MEAVEVVAWLRFAWRQVEVAAWGRGMAEALAFRPSSAVGRQVVEVVEVAGWEVAEGPRKVDRVEWKSRRRREQDPPQPMTREGEDPAATRG